MHNLDTSIEWLREMISKIEYGECAISVTVHQGQVRQIERILQEKVRP